MTDHPTPLKPCPTPDKWRYRSAGEAMAGVPFNKATKPHHPYRCCCGWYHITSHPRTRA
jgi:hypothetical protein